jgi:hypothetical protein
VAEDGKAVKAVKIKNVVKAGVKDVKIKKAVKDLKTVKAVKIKKAAVKYMKAPKIKKAVKDVKAVKIKRVAVKDVKALKIKKAVKDVKAVKIKKVAAKDVKAAWANRSGSSPKQRCDQLKRENASLVLQLEEARTQIAKHTGVPLPPSVKQEQVQEQVQKQMQGPPISKHEHHELSDQQRPEQHINKGRLDHIPILVRPGPPVPKRARLFPRPVPESKASLYLAGKLPMDQLYRR